MAKIIHQAWHGPVPSNYVEVHRWVNEAEAMLWHNATHIPHGLRSGEHVYVTVPGAPQGGGKLDAYRIEFCIPEAMLHKAGRDDWRQIHGPIGNTPILNLRIVAPDTHQSASGT